MQQLLYLFTRTPLHVGAGSSVGAIDQPIQRERHTGFPIIPASSLKGTFADAWNDTLIPDGDRKVRVKKDGDRLESSDAAWLFGSDDANNACAGALQFSEAKLLAFPLRSAKGSFAWITSPLILNRYHRALEAQYAPIDNWKEDDQAIFAKGGALDLEEGQIVLEEYTFKHRSHDKLLNDASKHLAGLLEGDPVWSAVKERLVILSDGMMSYFAKNACEVAQHVRISDETGTAEGGALFNQENVPGETLFYSLVHGFAERTAGKAEELRRSADEALGEFEKKLKVRKNVFQFGGDASTGLGYCTINLAKGIESS